MAYQPVRFAGGGAFAATNAAQGRTGPALTKPMPQPQPMVRRFPARGLGFWPMPQNPMMGTRDPGGNVGGLMIAPQAQNRYPTSGNTGIGGGLPQSGSQGQFRQANDRFIGLGGGQGGPAAPRPAGTTQTFDPVLVARIMGQRRGNLQPAPQPMPAIQPATPAPYMARRGGGMY